MKSYTRYQSLVLSTALAIMPFAGRSTVFFQDTFSNGSTLTNGTAAPTPTSTAYQLSSSKNWVPNPPILAPNDLKFGIGSTTSGGNELQALFTSTPVSLTAVGDYIRLTVTFTNGGHLTASELLGFGLYNGNQVQPVAGGLFGTAVNTFTDHTTGGVQNWQGYWGQRAFSGNSRMVLRLPQTAPDNRNQNLTSTGSGSLSYGSPAGATIGANNATASGPLDTNGVYTVVLAITLTDVNTLTMTNYYYNGPNTNGTEVCEFGATASGSSYTGATFDALAVGWRATGTNATGTAMDISSIMVDGSVTVVSAPPTITLEPVDTTVGAGGSVPFFVAADGINVTYQWRRGGTNIVNGANISGATTATLVINNASAADALSGANGYYCVVSGAGNFSTNSTTNSLTIVAAKNLVWNGTGNIWDLNNNPSWNDGANTSATFNYGDSVTFDDTGAGNPLVTLSGTFLSASKWLVAGTTSYAFGGSGHFAGTGPLVFNSGAGGTIQLNVANTHTGGTIVSNSNSSLNIYCQQYQVLGNGPLILAKPGMMEFFPAGSATLGIPGDIAVNDDFTIQFDGTGTFAGVMLGNIAGASGKTLTLVPQNTAATNRYRAYGPALVCNANIAVNPNGTPTTVAQYNGTVLAPYAASPSIQTFNGVISGNGGLVQRGTATTILNGANTFTGGTTPTTGAIGLGNDAALGTGVLNIAPETGSASGSGVIFASGGARTIANAIQYPDSTTNQTLIIGGTNNITFSGAFNLSGADGSVTPTNRTLQVTNTAATTFSGVISDSGAGDGIVKTGNGNLYLNGVNTYTGTNLVSAGRLTGSGTLAGSMGVQTNAAIGGGSAANIGTLTVNGDVALSSGANVFIRVNKALSQSNDLVSVGGALTHAAVGTNTGTVTVTNLGVSAIAAGDTFKIFSKAMTGGSTLAIVGSGLTWTNNLAVDGSIVAGPAVSTVATNSTNMVFSISGTNINISWPADHLGWYLQMNTNSLASNSWVDVVGSNAGTNSVVPIDPAKSKAFFRMSLQP